jgi:hypothetical protein
MQETILYSIVAITVGAFLSRLWACWSKLLGRQRGQTGSRLYLALDCCSLCQSCR